MGMALGRMVRSKQVFILITFIAGVLGAWGWISHKQGEVLYVCLILTAPVERRAGMEGMWFRTTVGPTIIEFYRRGGMRGRTGKLSVSNGHYHYS